MGFAIPAMIAAWVIGEFIKANQQKDMMSAQTDLANRQMASQDKATAMVMERATQRERMREAMEREQMNRNKPLMDLMLMKQLGGNSQDASNAVLGRMLGGQL